ncbi:MAG: acetoacetate decarboxylase family protein [Pseudomonadales bacterium]|nr:acetoacetate decarboxylase family protein [Pseudomonadales bacterium]
MKYLLQISLVLLAFCQSLSFSSYVYGGLLDDYPQSETATILTTGQEIHLPLHVNNLWGMAIIGTIDLKAATDGMRSNDLYPIKVSDDKGLAIIYVLDYREASLGPYQEIMTLIGVTTNPNATVAENLIGFGSSYLPAVKDFLAGKVPGTGVYFEKISLDSPLAITTGIEVWGIPKTYEQFQIENHFWSTSVASVEVSFELKKGFGLWSPLLLNLASWTSTDYKQTRGETLLSGWGRTGLIGLNDTFVFGENLQRLSFKPYVWQEILSGTDAVFFEGSIPAQVLSAVE